MQQEVFSGRNILLVDWNWSFTKVQGLALYIRTVVNANNPRVRQSVVPPLLGCLSTQWLPIILVLQGCSSVSLKFQ